MWARCPYPTHTHSLWWQVFLAGTWLYSTTCIGLEAWIWIDILLAGNWYPCHVPSCPLYTVRLNSSKFCHQLNAISIGVVVEPPVFLTFWIFGRRRWGFKGVRPYRHGGHLGIWEAWNLYWMECKLRWTLGTWGPLRGPNQQNTVGLCGSYTTMYF